MGYWYNRRAPKEILVTSISIMIISDLLYALIPNKYSILFSRLIAGFAVGNFPRIFPKFISTARKPSRNTSLSLFDYHGF